MSTRLEELHLHAAFAHLLPPADLDRNEDWQDAATCKETDPEVFFPEKGDTGREAKTVCRRCPVMDECLEWALLVEEPHGVWGGTTPRERRRIAAERRHAQTPAIDLGERKKLIADAADRKTSARDLADRLGCSVEAAQQALLRHRRANPDSSLGAA